MRALRIASRNSGSSAASMVICVKKFMSLGSFDELLHQLEPLGAQRLQLVQTRVIGAARCLLEIFERDRVEIVVS